jgi:hypothetical protein
MDANDVLRLEKHAHTGLRPEAFLYLRVVDALVDELERDALLRGGVVRFPDRAHAAAADSLEELVATGDHGAAFVTR